MLILIQPSNRDTGPPDLRGFAQLAPSHAKDNAVFESIGEKIKDKACNRTPCLTTLT